MCEYVPSLEKQFRSGAVVYRRWLLLCIDGMLDERADTAKKACGAHCCVASRYRRSAPVPRADRKTHEVHSRALIKYPIAKSRPVSVTFGCVSYSDHYRWLEEESPESQEWESAQNELTRAWFDSRPATARDRKSTRLNSSH